MIRSTVLNIGDVINVSNKAREKALEFDTLSLILGYQVQYTHNEILVAAGYQIEEPADPRAPYDRAIVGHPFLQDDKVATFETKDGKLSLNHNLTQREHDKWKSDWLQRNQDTIIQCFEYLDRTYTSARYMGPVSFALLYGAPAGAGIRSGKESYFFDRHAAYKYNLLREPS